MDGVAFRRAAADLPAMLRLLVAHRFYERIGYVPSHLGMKKSL